MGARFHQARVVASEEVLGTVEAAMMRAAYQVLSEDPATPGHTNRLATAKALFFGLPQDIARFTRLFAWRVVFDPTLAGQVFNPSTKAITPEAMDDTALDAAVAAFWNTASNVPAE